MHRPRANGWRGHYTVGLEWVGPDAWHLTVDELPDSWTVAFSLDEVEERIRTRIALDTGQEPDEFEVRVIPRGSLFLERRATRREEPERED